jgi:transposase
MLAQRASGRDLQALERRRKQAARLFAKGTVPQASVARELKVSRMSVSRWYRHWKKSGRDALKAAPRAGRKPLLNARHLQRLEAVLRKGARAQGFSADLWSCPRVATVIERLTGVRYHPGHVWKILGTMNWTVQKPERQAKERNPDQVAYWKTARWPELKKTLLASTPGSSFKTKPDSPSNPRSAGPGRRQGKPRSAGQFQHRKSHWLPERAEAFRPRHPSHLGLGSSSGTPQQCHETLPIRAARLAGNRVVPGYAPDLNPTEAVWNNIKGRELANLCADRIEEAAHAFRTGLRRVAHTVPLPFSFLRHAGLFF